MAMTADDYANAIRALLPPGPAWGADVPHLSAWVAVLAKMLADLDAGAIQRLVDESDPYRTLYLLSALESSLGLPDSCVTSSPTLAERRASIVARLTDAGGARVTRFLQIAKALGYPDCTVTRFSAHNCESGCDAPLYGAEWRFAWQLNVPTASPVIYSTTQSGCDEPLATWGDTVLACVMQRENPQPSILQINFG